ncbi:MAG TPA: methyl-accepting chemotaxis protein [Bryobacteraceae bacterium]|nr:methyl-accepting chemotaxis protein [Bryobacteraceae bacterium]
MRTRALATRILILGVALSVLPSGVMLWMLRETRRSGYQLKTESTRHSVEAAWGILNWYGQQAGSGSMPLAEAQRAAKEIIRQMRFDNGNYTWINDLDAKMILHPAIPDYEGKDMSGFRDPDGIALFVEAARLAQAAGEGAIHYKWPRPGRTEPSPKISYVKLFPRWGWVVGSGVYVDDVESELSKSEMVLLGWGGIAVLLSLLLSYWVARSISKPIQAAAGRLVQSTDQTSLAVDQLAGASQNTAEALSRQASSLEQTSATLEELTAAAKRDSSGAQEIQELVNQVGVVVGEGNQHVTEMGTAIQEIVNSASKVRKIVKTIDEIAFQTNILALNAAVEAARAGEAGAGFSVVAGEVRNLAQRASQAAKETAELIQHSLESTEIGAAIGGKLSATFGGIVQNSAQATEGLTGITASFHSQVERISQVTAVVSQLSDLTQQQAAGSEQSASAAEELRAQVSSVRQMCGELAGIVQGGRAD